MRKRILLYYIVLIIVGMTITGIFVSQLTQSLYKDEVKHRLLTVATLFDHELSQASKSGSPIDYNTLAKDYAGSLDRFYNLFGAAEPADTSVNAIESRITVIDYKGNVLGESQTDYSSMENHLNRKEVQQAIHGEFGEDIRFSSTLKMDFLYIAIPSTHSDSVIRASVPLVQLKRINLLIWRYCLLGIFAGLLLTILFAFRFASNISRPVKELTYASKEIADGNYSKRAAVRSKDELGQLAATFNEMAEKLDKSVNDLKDKNIKFDAILNSMTNCLVAVDHRMRIILINSIATRFFGIGDQPADDSILGRPFIETIRNHHLNEIMQQTIAGDSSSVNEITIGMPDEGIYRVYASPIKPSDNSSGNSGAIMTIHDVTTIKKLERIRSEFVSNVTHELKTPLTSIRGFTETLKSGAVKDPEVAARFLDIIDIEAERLTMLINDILQLSEIENKESDTNISTINLNNVLEEVISILQGSADQKKVSLIMDAKPNIIIQANRDRIKQMLINLIHNAINYNVENGSVRIKAEKTEGRLVISVADTGIGIAAEHLPRIFERFYRVDKGRSRNMGGTGLGLSIVKHIVNLYDGDITVRSEPGNGTEFIVQLPV